MSPDLKEKFDNYPAHIRPLMLNLRELMFSVAQSLNIDAVEETLKWGEPSYCVKDGSAVRMDWKPKAPGQYCLYFHCQSKLVDTFREIYGDALVFEGNRAIVLDIHKPVPKKIIWHCVEVAFQYKKLKVLPLLGV